MAVMKALGMDIPVAERLANAVIASADASGVAKILIYTPYVAGNPFQRMLYAAAADAGFAVVPLSGFDELKNVVDCKDVLVGNRVICHFHWINGAIDAAKNEKQAFKHKSQFLDDVAALNSMGIQTIWTVHNILSHAAHFPVAEKQLRQEMADAVDKIHIMNPDTKGLVSSYFNLDQSKILQVPHPSYAGVYGDYLGRENARSILGLSPNQKVMLVFGGMGPHKGILRLLSQLDKIQEHFDGQAHVVLAGRKGPPQFMEQLYQVVAPRSDVTMVEGELDDQALQTCFQAADVVVCPYPRALNSGVAMTAASFGKPSVVPDSLAPVFTDCVEAVARFNQDEMDSLPVAVMAAFALSANPNAFSAIRGWAESLRPHTVSSLFFAALEKA